MQMDTGKSALGLDGNLAAALGYPIGIIAIICLVMEKENRFVKFHALQSILLHVALYRGSDCGVDPRDHPADCRGGRERRYQQRRRWAASWEC